ncbi:efflux transporter outer membrane subunit [Sphingomonas sp. 28-63-12]|uniref:efflux transporter outer membrane subunit n=1 Tax=Sphingomonas sp. 28-63-12 TaxID=1970434 RepID=UPI000BCE348C|nr:MAG: RND transporter [Sphingomonas sp. 28-63-12]
MLRLCPALVILVALPLGACAVGPNYAPPALGKLAVPDRYSTPAAPGAIGDGQRWWTSFNDPQLTGIIDTAIKQNLDIAQAVARLRQARESLVQSRASLLPSASASAGYSRNINVRGQSFGNITNAGIVNENYSISADASYQLDLFGGIRRGVEAQRGALQASQFTLANVQSSIAAEVARNYILARSAQASLAIAKGSLAIQDDNLEIAGFRVQAGLVSSLDAEQSRSQRAQTATQIPSLEQNFQQAANRLGVLTGQAPGALKADLAEVKPIPEGPAAIPVGIPADIIRLRPDVRAAERTLAAATARIGVAEADLYPALSIGASLSTNAGAINTLTDIITGRVFGSIAQTIFDAGRNRSVVRARRAAAEESLAAYRGAVLTALEDVENALTAMATAEARQRDFAVALDASSNAAILARSQYRAGLTDITTLNNTESALLSAQSGLTTARADQAQALVQLYLALGGGWDSASPPEPPAK